MKSYLPQKERSALAALTLAPAPGRQPFPALGTQKPEQSGHGGIQIETVKEGDKVVRLVVTCACGERIEVECIYPAGS